MKISVIVPVYNSEQYLTTCIKSIINQTYSNIEILLINDGSTDNSLDIMNKFAQESDKIKIYSKKNSGVSDTRNVGIDNSTGEFLLFIDSDDFIDLDYVSKAVDYIEKNNLEYLKCSYIEKRGSKENVIKYYSNTVFSQNEIINEISISDNFSSIGGVFVKKSIIDDNNIRFSKEYKYGEDMLFNYNSIIKCNKIGYLTSCNYYYVINSGSVSSNSDINNLYKYFLDNVFVISKFDKISDNYKANKILKKINIITKKYVFGGNSKYRDYRNMMNKMFNNDIVKPIINLTKLGLIEENKFNKINMFFLMKKFYFMSYIYLKFCSLIKK